MSRSTRHTAILVLVTLCGCLAAFGGWRFARASAPVNGPIILISVDGLRADRLSAYGYSGARTPAIDALAASGTVFERAYSNVPQTLPAHASLLTGRLPFETGVRDVAGYTLPPAMRTIAEVLRDRGYATGGIVSSYLLRRETGIERGFSFFDDELPTPDPARPFAWLTRDGAASEDVAEHWLDSAGTSRLFLFLHLPGASFANDGAATASAPDAYDVSTAQADASIGKLVQYLKAHQLYDRSTILVVSDHGEGLGDGGEQGHGLLVSESALRVALIVKPPAGDGRPGRVATPVQHVDVVPTILDLAKAPGGSGLRGRSLASALKGGTVASTPLYAESMYGAFRFGWAPLTSVIDGSYQLVADGADMHLYDLSAPVSSRADVSAGAAERFSALQRALAAFTDGALPSNAAPVTLADRERFEALGYVGEPDVRVADDALRPSTVAGAAFVERYRQAVRIGATGRSEDSIPLYRALAQEQPGLVDVWLHLARLEARHEHNEEALEAYRQALALEPTDGASQLGAAWALIRLRRLDEADELASGLLAAESAAPLQKAEGHELRARIALSRKDPELARAEADAAEAADSARPVRALVDGRLAFESGHDAEAVAAFESALAKATASGRAPLTDLRVFAAEALGRVDRQDDAATLLQAELDAFPANARARAAQDALRRNTSRQTSTRAQH